MGQCRVGMKNPGCHQWRFDFFWCFMFFKTVARTCSLIFIVLDVLKPLGHKRLIEYELEGFGIRYM